MTVRVWRRAKPILPRLILKWCRWVYSPGARRGHRAGLKRLEIRKGLKTLWPSARGEVSSGPFSGMRYIRASSGSALAPKIVGTYEKEIHHLIEEMIASAPSCVIDIGAAEGFYAVGFAMRLPHCRVIAFEANSRTRRWLIELATLNGVLDRIEVRGFCDGPALDACLESVPQDTVVICDAEGAEVELLDPLREKLRQFQILAELHHWVKPGLGQLMQTRFAPFGTCCLIESRKRAPADFPAGLKVALSPRQKEACMDELRPEGMAWLWVVPRTAVQDIVESSVRS
jgi:hypothetical protein